jgi:uncharacterized protein
VTSAPKPRARRCPICGKGPLGPGRRFCSDRCQTVDLGRWLGGDYAIPAAEAEPTAEDEPGGQG